MLKLFLQTILITTSASAIASSPSPIPEDWAAFKTSNAKENVALVSKISKAKWWKVCEWYGQERRKKKETRDFIAYREFLLSEDMLNGKDFMNIDSRSVAIGMSMCGVFASIGTPNHSNRTTTGNGTRHQLVFEHPRRYVYVQDSDTNRTGVVTGIQD